MSDPDRQAFARLTQVVPAWTAMRTAGDALGLPSHTLLHCGPPVDAACDLIIPVLNSAAVACVFEGWATDLDQARRLVASGAITFAAAQDWRLATPMAAVVSRSMWLIEMSDLGGSAAPAYAPINGGGTGGDPAPRYGRCSSAAVEFLSFLNGEVAQALVRASGQPLSWLPLIDCAITEGDDAHLRHGAAHKRLIDELRRRLGAGFDDSAAGAFMSKWPFFHLNFAMAAIRCALGGAEGVPGSGLVTALGGNGTQFGLQVSGLPRRWFAVPADAPRGKVREPHGLDSGTGALGDSAVVEAFGLGAMAQRYAPDMQALHAGFCPPDLHQLPRQILLGLHPGLPRSSARAAMSVAAVCEANATPVLELGIVDRAGDAGGLGAGIYRPPMALFAAADAALRADGESCR